MPENVPPPIAPPLPDLPPESPQDIKLKKLIRSAKQNTITMFVVFVLATAWLAITVLLVTITGHRNPVIESGGCIGISAIAGGVFAAIYLPLRWKTIMSLDPSFRILGLIGGFGLIGFCLLEIVGLIMLSSFKGNLAH